MQTRSLRLLDPLWAAPLLLASCFVSRDAVSEPLDHQIVARLQPGVTTAAEAVRLLGAPSHVVELHDRSAYYYEAKISKDAAFSIILLTFSNTDTRTDRLWLFFDASDRLTHVASTLGVHRARYAMPWSDLHDQQAQQAADARRLGAAR
ncbi:MAG: hypothetical protein R3F56_10165 [Planctomycetota bacterium]